MKFGAVSAMGAATFGGSFLIERQLTPRFEIYSAEYDVAVKKCAQELGGIATKSVILPVNCRDLEYLFSKEKILVTRSQPLSEEYELVRDDTKYIVPTTDEFLSENIGEQQIEELSNTDIAKMGGLMSILSMGIMAVALRSNKKQLADKP